jgi:hypothetical protein
MSLEASRSDINASRVRRHIVTHWRAWVACAILVVVVNELVDRNFFDHREHIDGDFVITVGILLIAISLSYAVARLRARRPSPP